MSDELVERLRGDWFGYDVSLKAIDAMDEAADRIEGLEENQRFIIRERDRTFSLMLALAEKAEAERDRAEDELYELQQTCITLRGENEALTAVQPDARETALREAASYHELLAADEDALSAKYRGGSNPWFAHVQRASWHREHASAILALKGESHE